MLVYIQPVTMGYCLTPASQRKLDAILDDMKANGCKHPDEDVYFQGDEALEEALDGEIPAAKIKELEEGFRVQCRMDDWIVRHLYGYCSD